MMNYNRKGIGYSVDYKHPVTPYVWGHTYQGKSLLIAERKAHEFAEKHPGYQVKISAWYIGGWEIMNWFVQEGDRDKLTGKCHTCGTVITGYWCDKCDDVVYD